MEAYKAHQIRFVCFHPGQGQEPYKVRYVLQTNAFNMAPGVEQNCPRFLTSLGALLSKLGATHKARLVGLKSLTKICQENVGAMFLKYGFSICLKNMLFSRENDAVRASQRSWRVCEKY